MDNNIMQTVYDALEASTDEISKDVTERAKLDDMIVSGMYTQRGISEDLTPKRDALNRKIQDASDKALKAAQDIVDQYKKDIDEMNRLNPDEITDDVKLLQPGITLLPRDIMGILKRNEGNRTMEQIAIRYAEDHNIDIGRVVYIGGQQERATARGLDEILHYYKKWIGTQDAKTMLKKFFNVED